MNPAATLNLEVRSVCTCLILSLSLNVTLQFFRVYFYLHTFHIIRSPSSITSPLFNTHTLSLFSYFCPCRRWCAATARRDFPASRSKSWSSTSRVTESVPSARWSATTWSSPCSKITSTVTSCERALGLRTGHKKKKPSTHTKNKNTHE